MILAGNTVGIHVRGRAYLNNNPDKIVVAPAVWHIDAKYDSVCPPDWIRL